METLYREVKASERLPEASKPLHIITKNGHKNLGVYYKGKWYDSDDCLYVHNPIYWLEPIDITDEDLKSFYKVIKIAEEYRFMCGDDDDKDVFNAYMIFRRLTGIEGSLSKFADD